MAVKQSDRNGEISYRTSYKSEISGNLVHGDVRGVLRNVGKAHQPAQEPDAGRLNHRPHSRSGASGTARPRDESPEEEADELHGGGHPVHDAVLDVAAAPFPPP